MMNILSLITLLAPLLQTSEDGTNLVDVVVSFLWWFYFHPWELLLIALGYIVIRFAWKTAKRLVEGTGPGLSILILIVTVIVTLIIIGLIFVGVWGVPKIGTSLYAHGVRQLNNMEGEYPLPGTPFPDATQPPGGEPPSGDYKQGQYQIEMAAGQGDTCTIRETSDRNSRELGQIPNGTHVRIIADWVASNSVAGCALRGNIQSVGNLPSGWIHCSCVGSWLGP